MTEKPVKSELTEVENKELCRKCGGVCCKNMACHFSPDDFPEITFNALKAEIEKGHISIDCWEGDIDKKKNYYGRVYYLRIKNKGAGIVDFSWGGVPCSLLTETGCPLPFEKRPKGARALIPSTLLSIFDIPGNCVDGYTKEMCAMDWRKHQKVMKEVVTHFGF